jgi:hypothetical protein
MALIGGGGLMPKNDYFERVYPVERIVLAPSLPRVDEISAS